MNIPIYPGSSSFFPGDTPFNFFDNDYQFQVDADKVTRFCALRLGYPITEVELQDINFYAAFEEAVITYGNELYAFQIRDNYLSLEGANTSINVSQSIIIPTMANIVKMSQQYAEEAGVGGNVNWYSGSVTFTSSIQDYDLVDWAVSQSITGGIEIKRIFHEGVPAISELYSPYAGLGAGISTTLGVLGASGFNSSTSFLMMPLSFDMQSVQAIELSNQFRLSNYSFTLINNKLRIFPIPTNNFHGTKLWFEYIKLDDRINSGIISGSGKINNVSNVPYNNIVYSQINSVGRSWIFDYTLALCKEMLGYIRGKYTTVPIPGSEVTLNQSDLITSSTAMKDALILRLREFLDQTSRQSLLERRNNESIARNNELNQSPMPIYIA